MNIIFLGAPGSGKGTQTHIISNILSLPIISTGDILRSSIKEQGEIGKKAKKFIDEGVLVPDEIILLIINEELSKDCYISGFIMDGFPRNLFQARELNKILDKINRKIDYVFELFITGDDLIKRMLGRFNCKKCGAAYNKFFKNTKIDNICDICNSSEFVIRSDDNEETIRKRQKVYEETSRDLIEFYSRKNLIYKVDATESPSLISDSIINIINN